MSQKGICQNNIFGSCVLVSVSGTVINDEDQKQLGKEKVFLTYTFMWLFIIIESQERNSNTVRNQRPKLMQRQWRDGANQLAHHGLFILFSYRFQSHKPRNGTIYNGLCPSPSINNLKNTLQAFLQPEIRRHFLNWGFLLILASSTPIIGVYVKLLKQGHHFLYSSCHLSCYLIEFLIVSCHSSQSICLLHLAKGEVKGRCGGNHHPQILQVLNGGNNVFVSSWDVILFSIHYFSLAEGNSKEFHSTFEP